VFVILTGRTRDPKMGFREIGPAWSPSGEWSWSASVLWPDRPHAVSEDLSRYWWQGDLSPGIWGQKLSVNITASAWG